MNRPGSKGFLEERAIPQLPEALPAIEVRALLPTATEAGLLHKGIGISIDTNLPRGTFWQFTPKGLETAREKIRESVSQAASSATNFSSFCTHLIVAMADYTDRQARGEFSRGTLELSEIARAYDLAFFPGWIRRASEVFADKAWAHIEYTLGGGEDGGIHATLNGVGFLEAERLKGLLFANGIKVPKFSREESFSSTTESKESTADVSPSLVAGSTGVKPPGIEGFAPASDRIVRLDDNAPGRKEALENLERIETALESGSNELTLTADERVVVLSETRSLRQRLADGRVRLGALFQAIAPHGFLFLIIGKLAEDAIGLAASVVLSAIKTLLQVFL
jgi:hypothetical protein